MPLPPAAALSASLLAIAASSVAALVPTQAVAPPSACVGTDFAGGTGTAGDPYLLSSEQDLQRLSTGSGTACLTKHFRQTTDIALTSAWSYQPIGSAIDRFTGTYDGQGHQVSGLVVDTTLRPDGLGLFGHVGPGGVVQDLTVIGRVDGNPATTDDAGLVAGYVSHAKLIGVHARGAVIGTTRLGGVAGFVTYESVISRSSSSATVTGYTQVGGLVGYLQGSTISQSRANGDVTATVSNTGLAGGLTSGGSLYGSAYAAIENSYATGAVNGSASGTPVGTNGIGGIIGSAPGGGRLRVINSYATGRLTRTAGTGTGFGGIIGTDAVAPAGSPAPIPSTFTGSVWTTDTVGPLGAVSGYGTGLTSAQMQAIGSFTALGWGIVPAGTSPGTNPWGICSAVNGGLPYLQWEYPSATCPATGPPTVPTVVDPQVAATLSAPVFSRATRAPQTGRTRLVTRLQLGAAGTYTFIMLRTDRDVRLAQQAGSAIASRTLTARSGAPTFTVGATNSRIVLRTYFSARAVPLRGAAVRLLVIHRAPGGSLTSTLIVIPVRQ